MNEELLIVESKTEECTFFLFRPLMINRTDNYREIKFKVDFFNKTIKSSTVLTAREKFYIKSKIIDGNFMARESVLNYDIMDYELNKAKSYQEL